MDIQYGRNQSNHDVVIHHDVAAANWILHRKCISFFTRQGALLVLLLMAGLLAGCSDALHSGLSNGPATASLSSIKGSAHGGQQPVVNATIQLYAAGTADYGSAGRPLINCSGPADVGGVPTGPCTGVTTNQNGNFTITGDYVCPAGAYIYITATGGNSNASVGSASNSALALMAGLGACSSFGTSSFVNINEVTTAATVTALQQFMSATYGTPFAESIGAPASNSTGLANAFAAIPQLVNISNGTSLGSGSSTATINDGSVLLSWVTESSKLDTLGNILSYCVNSGDTTGTTPTISSQCTGLFSAAKPAGQTNAPADTIQAMLDLATNPTNVAGPFAYVNSFSAFPSPLANAPNDWTLNISYYSNSETAYPPLPATGADAFFLGSSYNLAVDANGVVWVVGTGSLSAISPGGIPSAQVLNTSSLNTSVNEPRAIAFDTSNNLYVANYGATSTNAILEYTTSGSTIAYSTTSSYKFLYSLAIDGRNNVFALSQAGQGSGPDAVVEIPSGSTDGTAVSLVQHVGKLAYGIAVDSSYNIWATAQQAGLGGANAVTEIACTGTTSCTYPNVGLSYTGGTGSGEMYQPFGIAIDAVGDPWIANGDVATTYVPGTGPYDGNHLTKLTPGSQTTGTGTTSGDTTPGTGGLNDPEYLAIDGASNIWVANNGIGGNKSGDDVSEFKNDATPLSGPNGFLVNVGSTGTVTANMGPRGIAIDSSGNVWISNLGGKNSSTPSSFGITELVGAAVPAVTPLAVGVMNNKLGQRP